MYNLRKIKTLFSSGGYEKNEFNNSAVYKDDLPSLWKTMNEHLTSMIAASKQRAGINYLNIPVGYIDLQWHTRSINEHTDDISPGEFFQLFVLSTFKAKEFIDSYVETEPHFHYYDERGKKKTTCLDSGKSVIFNPRKPHSVVYYGESYLVACRTVVRKKVEK